LIEKLAQHPLARVLRADKLALAALTATLRLYRNAETAQHAVPLLSLLSTPLENLKNRAERLAPQMAASAVIAAAMPVPGQATLTDCSAKLAHPIPTWCVALTPKSGSPEDLAKSLRTGAPAVLGRVEGGIFLLDLRSVPPSLDIHLTDAVLLLGGVKSEGAWQEDPGNYEE
jgi:L-seryl-tRNA(Ser) seleniumtransferase